MYLGSCFLALGLMYAFYIYRHAMRMQRYTIPFYAHLYEKRIRELAYKKDLHGMRILHDQIARSHKSLSIERQCALLQEIERFLASIKYTR